MSDSSIYNIEALTTTSISISSTSSSSSSTDFKHPEGLESFNIQEDPDRLLYFKAPCIGICSTTYGDSVCRGCKRYSYEIIHWNRYSLTEKKLIWQRLELSRVRLIQNLVIIADRQLLEQSLLENHITFLKERNPYWYTYDIIKRLSKETPLSEPTHLTLKQHLSVIGLLPTSTTEDWSLRQLHQHIEKQLYLLAEAEHERQHRHLKFEPQF